MNDLDIETLDQRIGKRVKVIDKQGNEDSGVLDFEPKENAYVLRWWGHGYRFIGDDQVELEKMTIYRN